MVGTAASVPNVLVEDAAGVTVDKAETATAIEDEGSEARKGTDDFWIEPGAHPAKTSAKKMNPNKRCRRTRREIDIGNADYRVAYVSTVSVLL